MRGPADQGRNCLAPHAAPLVPVSLFLLLAVMFARCGDAHAQSFPVPSGASVSWQDKKDAVQKVTEEDGFWIPKKVGQQCLVLHEVSGALKERWLDCEQARAKRQPEGKLGAYVTGGAVGGALVAILMAVLRVR